MRRVTLCFFLFLSSLSLFAQTKPPQIYAMIVGISQYQDGTIPNLKFAAKDAIAFADFLKTPQAGAVPPQNISLLTDEKATRSAILKELVNLLSRSGPEDLFIFYFSGHGKNGLLENTGYLLSYDTENENEEGSALSMDEISNKINHGKAKMKVSYVDACHAGLLKGKDTKGVGGDNQEIVNAYLAGVANASDGNASFLASSSRQPSLEDDKLGHGVFTYYLLKGLQGEADLEQKDASGYNDGIVTISEMQTYLNRKIEEATKYKQKPSVVGDFDNEFPLSVLKASVSIVKEIAKRPKKEPGPKPSDLPTTIKLPEDVSLPAGITLTGTYCYGILGIVNTCKFPITVYKMVAPTTGSTGYYETNLKIAPNGVGQTPRLYVWGNKQPSTANDCLGFAYDYHIYLKMEENGKTKYAKQIVSVIAGKKTHILLSPDNLDFQDKEPL